MTQRSSFRYDLQGLRAVAVLFVIASHSGLGIAEGGFIGVDIFFVLSGFLITGFLLLEVEQQQRIDFLQFYARRLKRLLPALLLMVAVSTALAVQLLSATEAHSQLSSLPYVIIWLSNMYFAFSEVEYFDELSDKDLFLHTWSLGVEEQFYLIWPLVLLIVFRFSQQAAQGDRGRRLIIGTIVVLLISLVLSLFLSATQSQLAFYLMPSRIWQFSLGALVFMLCSHQVLSASFFLNRWLRSQRTLFLFLGLALIMGCALGLDTGVLYPGWWALLPSVGAALVIAAGCSAGTETATDTDSKSLLANPVLVWLGDRSYSLYLWHWPVFMLGFSMGYKGQWVPTLYMVLLAVLASMVTYRLVELPFWKGKLSQGKPSVALLVSVLVIAGSVTVANQGLPRLLPSEDAPDVSRQWRVDVPQIYPMGCDAWYTHAEVQPCVFESETSRQTVVVLGDSIGLQWFSMVPMMFPVEEWKVIVLTKSSCAMVDEDYYYQRIGKHYSVCTEWRNAVLDQLETIRPAVIFVGSAATYDLTDKQWVEGSARVFERLSNAAGNVFVLPGTPNLGFDGPGCVSRSLSADGLIDPTSCLAKDRLDLIQSSVGFVKEATERFSNVHYLDLNPLVCPGGVCRAINQQGVVVFRDTQHLTDSCVRQQTPNISTRGQTMLSWP